LTSNFFFGFRFFTGWEADEAGLCSCKLLEAAISSDLWFVSGVGDLTWTPGFTLPEKAGY